jgi:hypothetical protein
VNWLLVEGTEVLACGSWQAVIEAGEEMGLIGRRYSQADGSETTPKMFGRGLIMVPAGMIPESELELAYA